MPRLWWRDEGARKPTPPLGRLIDIADGRPLTIAIDPARDLAPLAVWLGLAKGISVALYGVHGARQTADGDGDHAVEALAGDLRAARAAMIQAGVPPFAYVPAWGRVDEILLAALAQAEFRVLSLGPGARPTPGLAQVNAAIDLMTWRGPQPRFAGTSAVLGDLRRGLRARRLNQAWSEPLGLVTRHAVLDEPAWRFLLWFAEFSDGWFQWTALEDLAAMVGGGRTVGGPRYESFDELNIPAFSR